MILRVEKELSQFNRIRTIIVMQCDDCDTIFSKQKRGNTFFDKAYQFCSNACRINALRKNNLLNIKMRNSNVEKYGTEYTTQLDTTKDKCKETCKNRYNVEYTGQIPEAIEKRKSTNLERYGVENVFSLPSTVLKSQQTKIERYGNIGPNVAKMKETNLEKYGVEGTLLEENTRKKANATILQKYGVTYVFQSPEVQRRMRQTNLERYGVEYAIQAPSVQAKIDHNAIAAKSHQTKKKNGTYGKSKIESIFYNSLCDIFDVSNIDRFLRINKWSIDFYIKLLELYIQFDGVYWHGLERPIEKIMLFENKRDKTIYGTYCRDIEQNKWFKENNLKLIRITDLEFKNNNDVKSLIESKLRG